MTKLVVTGGAKQLINKRYAEEIPVGQYFIASGYQWGDSKAAPVLEGTVFIPYVEGKFFILGNATLGMPPMELAWTKNKHLQFINYKPLATVEIRYTEAIPSAEA